MKFKKHKKHKITRRELKEDKFMESIKNFIQIFQENKDKIVWGTIGGIIFILIVFYYFNHRKNTITAADNVYTFAVIQYANGKYKDVEPQFIRLIQEYWGTVQGKRALFFLANTHFFEGRVDSAEKEFERFTKLKFDPLFTPSAYEGIGECYEQQGKLNDAIKFYKKALSVSKFDFQKYDIYRHIGTLYEQMGKISEAEDIYNKIVSMDIDEGLKKPVRRRLKILKGIRSSIGS